MIDAIAIFLYGIFVGYAVSNARVKFEIMKLKAERKGLEQDREECYKERKKYEEYKRIKNNLIKHGFLTEHGKQTTTKED